MPRYRVWVVLAAGLAVRLVIAPLGAHPGDFATLTGWADAIQVHGWLNVYAVTDANYPPLALLLLGASRWVASLIEPGPAAGAVWMILLKLPAILADLAIGWALTPEPASSGWRGWLPVLGVVFNPALVYLSAWWGQLESIYVLFALLSVDAARTNRPVWAGVWLALGAMVKLQALVAAPIVILVIATAGYSVPVASRLWRFVLGGALPLILLIGPFAATGQGELIALRLVALVGAPGWLTVNALNLWYLVTGGAGNWRFNSPLTMPDTNPILFGLSARLIGLILVTAWTIIALAGLWRRPLDRSLARTEIFTAMAMLYLGVFFFPTQSHERYAFGAVVMLAGALRMSQAGARRQLSLLALYGLITLLHFGNLVWAAPFWSALDGWFAGSQPVGVFIAGGLAITGLCCVGLAYRWRFAAADLRA